MPNVPYNIYNMVTSHASIAYRKQLSPQLKVVAYEECVGIKTPLLKESRNTDMKSETNQTTNGRPPAVMATVGLTV